MRTTTNARDQQPVMAQETLRLRVFEENNPPFDPCKRETTRAAGQGSGKSLRTGNLRVVVIVVSPLVADVQVKVCRMRADFVGITLQISGGGVTLALILFRGHPRLALWYASGCAAAGGVVIRHMLVGGVTQHAHSARRLVVFACLGLAVVIPVVHALAASSHDRAVRVTLAWQLAAFSATQAVGGARLRAAHSRRKERRADVLVCRLGNAHRAWPVTHRVRVARP